MPEAPDDTPRERHPISEVCLAALIHGESELYELSPAGRKQLKKALAEHFEQDDLVAAVEELVVFAWFLSEQKGCPKAAKKVIKIAETAIPALEARGVNAQKVLAGDGIDRSNRAAAAEMLSSPLRRERDPRLDKIPEEQKNLGGVLGILNKK